MVWACSSDGTFTTKSAYEAISHCEEDQEARLFTQIWRWPGQERIRILLWKAAREVLMTNVTRVRRHFTDSDLCPICGGQTESLFHCFRDCPRISFIWQQLHPPSVLNFFAGQSWRHWLYQNIKHPSCRIGKQQHHWAVIFGVTFDLIWRARNEFIFHGKVTFPRAIIYSAQSQS